MNNVKHPEILAPGGAQLSIRAAIAAGADAVYLGYGSYNARRNADSLTADELQQLSFLAKSYHCRLYITLNTLLTSDELDDAVRTGLDAIRLGADALIVQDLGLARLLRNCVPEIPLHASTQCTTHNKAQVEFLAAHGFSRVNLSRELNLEEINSITECAHAIGMETEVFVHGAYCVGFSGQCYMSSFMGGRSGNRGICFQPCRRPYLASENSSDTPEYLLSLKDNNALDLSEQLTEAGVDSLKIEGRLKSFQYVYANVCAWSSKLKGFSPDNELPSPGEQDQVFNRGFDSGYLSNRVTSYMKSGRPHDKSLEILGEVESFNASQMTLSCKNPLPESEELMIYQDEQRFIATGFCKKSAIAGTYHFTITGKLKDKIETGQRICRSPIRNRAAELESWLMSLTPAKVPLNMKISGASGTKLVLEASTADNSWIQGQTSAESNQTLQAADNVPLTIDTVSKQLSKLGGTPFVLNQLEWNIEGNQFIPLGQINLLRRTICEHFLKNILAEKAETALQSYSASFTHPHSAVKKVTSKKPSLMVVCNDVNLIQKCLAALDKNDHLLFEVPLLSEQQTPQFIDDWPADNRVLPYLPSIIPDHSFDTWYMAVKTILHSSPCNSFLCDNSGMGHKLALSSGKHWIPGYAMNLSNASAICALEESNNITQCIPSLELSREQLAHITNALPGRCIIPIAGPVALMTTAQCMTRYAHGVSKCPKERLDRDCFKMCNRKTSIKDDRGRVFPVLKSPGYYARIFNESLLWIPEAIRELGSSCSAFLVDTRNFDKISSLSKKEADQVSMAIVESVITLLKGTSKPPQSSFIYPGGLTRGNYRRGLS